MDYLPHFGLGALVTNQKQKTQRYNASDVEKVKGPRKHYLHQRRWHKLPSMRWLLLPSMVIRRRKEKVVWSLVSIID